MQGTIQQYFSWGIAQYYTDPTCRDALVGHKASSCPKNLLAASKLAKNATGTPGEKAPA